MPRLRLRHPNSEAIVIRYDIGLHITGAMIYVDQAGAVTFYEGVFTKIETCRKHYIEIGLGGDYINQFIR